MLGDAIGEQRRLLARDPLSIDPYRALYRLHLQERSCDQAWCAAAAMAFLEKADAEERRFYEDYKPRGMPAVKGRLNNELWVRSVFHADQDLYVSKLFEMIGPAALQDRVMQLRAQGTFPRPHERFKQDPAKAVVAFVKAFGWAAQVLGVEPPELYLRSDLPGGIVAVPSVPPASVAGNTLLTLEPQELAFICGKHLSYYRGEHYVRTLFTRQAELTIMLLAGVMIAAPDRPMPPGMAAQIRATAQELVKYMEPVQLEALRIVVRRFLDEGAVADIERWKQTVEITACRAGLILCGDLEIAKKIIGSEPLLPGDLTPAEKMKELLLYFVSDAYSRVRQALGIAVA